MNKKALIPLEILGLVLTISCVCIIAVLVMITNNQSRPVNVTNSRIISTVPGTATATVANQTPNNDWFPMFMLWHMFAGQPSTTVYVSQPSYGDSVEKEDVSEPEVKSEHISEDSSTTIAISSTSESSGESQTSSFEASSSSESSGGESSSFESSSSESSSSSSVE